MFSDFTSTLDRYLSSVEPQAFPTHGDDQSRIIPPLTCRVEHNISFTALPAATATGSPPHPLLPPPHQISGTHPLCKDGPCRLVPLGIVGLAKFPLQTIVLLGTTPRTVLLAIVVGSSNLCGTPREVAKIAIFISIWRSWIMLKQAASPGSS